MQLLISVITNPFRWLSIELKTRPSILWLYLSKLWFRFDIVSCLLLLLILHLYLDSYMHTYPASSTAGLYISNLTTLYFTVRQDDTLKMPEHSGSMLRGAFGVALRSLTCITDLPECKDCPLKQHCNFPRLFEVPALQLSGVQAVNPYVIHVPIKHQAPRPLSRNLTMTTLILSRIKLGKRYLQKRHIQKQYISMRQVQKTQAYLSITKQPFIIR